MFFGSCLSLSCHLSSFVDPHILVHIRNLSCVSMPKKALRRKTKKSIVAMNRRVPRYIDDMRWWFPSNRKHISHVFWLSSQRANVQKPSHLRICGEPICIGNAECVSILHRRNILKTGWRVFLYVVCWIRAIFTHEILDTRHGWFIQEEI